MSASHAPPPPPALLLSEPELRDVLLVRAFEESGEDPPRWTAAERERAGTEARADLDGRPAGPAQRARFLARRAAILADALAERSPLVARLRERHAPPVAWFVVPLVVLGLASNFLGAAREIHVVANPLMGLVAWNLLLFAGLAVAAAVGRHGARRSSGWASALGARLAALRRPRDGSSLGATLARFARELGRVARRLHEARARRLLHVGAMSLVVGALGGLYLRGLVLEYRPTWESTFLTPEQTEALLRVLFAPASALTGIPVPSVRELADGAAPWIHLYAATVVLLVLVPRSLLVLAETRRIRRLARALPLPTDAAYWRRLLASDRGEGLEVVLVPYSHPLPTATREALVALLHDVFGARAIVRAAPQVDYGAEVADVLAAAGGEAPRLVLCFGLAQTPESEVHGRLVEELRRARPGEPALVLVEGRAYRERLGATPASAERLPEHRRTWDRVLREAEATPLHVDLGETDADELVERAAALVAEHEAAEARA